MATADEKAVGRVAAVDRAAANMGATLAAGQQEVLAAAASWAAVLRVEVR